MTATAEPPAPPVEAPLADVLDRAEGVELLGDVHGSGYRDGAALVRRADGQMVQLGPLMYALLEEVDGRRTPAELADALCERLGRACDEEHVLALAKKLSEHGLLAGTEENAPPRRNPLLALRWKVLVTNPAVTKRLTAPFTFLFKPFLVVPVIACFAGVFWFVLIHKGIASGAAQAFDTPELLLLVFVLVVASAGFHELGHASACRYGGGTPGGMGMGIYMVWPAFYTDVTDAYRLPKRDRLRTDLGGLYFNAIIAVVTMGVWLATRVDALLLLIALQMLEMVKQLSPVIRADGYHILSDATGIPDLYAHIGPTLRRLIPGREREPSALKGRARLLVTAWVLVVVPVLLSLMLGAVLLLPHLAASTWHSGRELVGGIPGEDAWSVLASVVRLFALALPVVGTVLMVQKVLRDFGRRGIAWSAGRPARRAALVAAAAAACAGAAWAWWPSGQYEPVRADQDGTLASFAAFVAAPVPSARPDAAAFARPIHLSPGPHLAVSMIPVGGATKEHPAMFFIAGDDGQPAVAILSDSVPDAAAMRTQTAAQTQQPAAVTTTATTTTSAAAASTTTASTAPPQVVGATAFPFKLPDKPKPGDTQALAVGTKDGGVTYNIAYSLVTVHDGADVTNQNSAYALASCKGCTTVAVSFQVVLIVGTSKKIAPINVAEALNGNCPACVTTAIADQIVVTLDKEPTPELLQKIEAALHQLDAIAALGKNASPAAVAAAVAAVQKQIDDAIAESGLASNKAATTTTVTTTTATTTTSPTQTATTTSTTTPAATTTATTTAQATTTTTTRAQTTATTTTTGAATTAVTTTTADTTTTATTPTATTTR